MIDPEFLAANIAEARPLPWLPASTAEIDDHTHCIVCVRAIGPSTDEAFYRADNRALCRDCYELVRHKAKGWYVRVTTDTVDEDGYNSVLYIAGFPTPSEAQAAVRKARGAPGETYEVLAGEITADRGPQPAPGEVRLLDGAK